LSEAASATDVRDRLRWRADSDELEQIRQLWIDHSKAEDARDLQGLIDTLTPDCVYEIPRTGQRWEGHDGARRFYTEFLGAFPDVHFDLEDIVVGAQGVIEIARMTGTHRGEWAGEAPSGARRESRVIIHFPWDRERRLFRGERIFNDL
jgi:ketosteroid isomerase-like protein